MNPFALSDHLSWFYAHCLYFAHSNIIRQDPRKRAELLDRTLACWHRASEYLNCERIPSLPKFENYSRFLSFHFNILQICASRLVLQRKSLTTKSPLKNEEEGDIKCLKNAYQSIQVSSAEMPNDAKAEATISSCVEHFLEKKEYFIALKIAAFLPIENPKAIIARKMELFFKTSEFESAIRFFNITLCFPSYYFWDPSPLFERIVSKNSLEKALSLIPKFSNSSFKTRGYQKLVDHCYQACGFDKTKELLPLRSPPVLGRLFYNFYRQFPESFSKKTEDYSNNVHSKAVAAAAKMFLWENDDKSAVNIALKSKNSHKSFHTLCEHVAKRVSFCEKCLIDFLKIFPEDAGLELTFVKEKLSRILIKEGHNDSATNIARWAPSLVIEKAKPSSPPKKQKSPEEEDELCEEKDGFSSDTHELSMEKEEPCDK